MLSSCTISIVYIVLLKKQKSEENSNFTSTFKSLLIYLQQVELTQTCGLIMFLPMLNQSIQLNIGTKPS